MEAAPAGGCGGGPGEPGLLARGHPTRGLGAHQRLVGVGAVLNGSRLTLVGCPLVDEAVVTGLAGAHPALAVLIHQESRLVHGSWQQL